MNICFTKNLFAMQQTESSAGQAGSAGQLSSQMCSQYPEFECLGKDVMDALKEGREDGGFIKTDIVRRKPFPLADIITGTYIWEKKR